MWICVSVDFSVKQYTSSYQNDIWTTLPWLLELNEPYIFDEILPSTSEGNCDGYHLGSGYWTTEYWTSCHHGRCPGEPSLASVMFLGLLIPGQSLLLVRQLLRSFRIRGEKDPRPGNTHGQKSDRSETYAENSLKPAGPGDTISISMCTRGAGVVHS